MVPTYCQGAGLPAEAEANVGMLPLPIDLAHQGPHFGLRPGAPME